MFGNVVSSICKYTVKKSLAWLATKLILGQHFTIILFNETLANCLFVVNILAAVSATMVAAFSCITSAVSAASAAAEALQLLLLHCYKWFLMLRPNS